MNSVKSPKCFLLVLIFLLTIFTTQAISDNASLTILSVDTAGNPVQIKPNGKTVSADPNTFPDGTIIEMKNIPQGAYVTIGELNIREGKVIISPLGPKIIASSEIYLTKGVSNGKGEPKLMPLKISVNKNKNNKAERWTSLSATDGLQIFDNLFWSFNLFNQKFKIKWYAKSNESFGGEIVEGPGSLEMSLLLITDKDAYDSNGEMMVFDIGEQCAPGFYPAWTEPADPNEPQFVRILSEDVIVSGFLTSFERFGYSETPPLLKKLTNKDFGLNLTAWKEWWETQDHIQ